MGNLKGKTNESNKTEIDSGFCCCLVASCVRLFRPCGLTGKENTLVVTRGERWRRRRELKEAETPGHKVSDNVIYSTGNKVSVL